jgi:hypothetical protein
VRALRTISLVLNLLALGVIFYETLAGDRMTLAQLILFVTFGTGTIALYMDRPFWFRTLAMMPLGFVVIFGVVFLGMSIFNAAKQGGWLEVAVVAFYLAAVVVNIWVINRLAPRSDRGIEEC